MLLRVYDYSSLSISEPTDWVALAPLCIGSNILSIYVVLPIVLILLSISTIYIENTLNKDQTPLNTDKKDIRPK